MRFWRWVLAALFFLPGAVLAENRTGSANAYMVENTAGTNGCYQFNTSPCSASITGISSGSISGVFNSSNTWTGTNTYQSTVTFNGPVSAGGSFGTAGQILTTNVNGAPSWSNSISLSSTNTWTGGQTFISSVTVTGAMTANPYLVATSTFPYGQRIVTSSSTLDFVNATETNGGMWNFRNADNTEVRLTGGSPSNTNGFYIFTDTSVTNGAFGVDANGNGGKGRWQFSPDGFTNNIVLFMDQTGVRVESVGTNAVWFRLGEQTLAQLRVLTPTANGQIYHCSTCATTPVVISTAATQGGFSGIASVTTVMQ